MTDKIKVFISYAREDCDTAKRLYDDLKAAGVTPWMDEENLLVGQNWKEGVRQAISESDYFLALISSTAIEKKGYYQTELNKALDELKENPPDKIYILPARIDNCMPKHDMLRNLNWADLFPSYENGLAKLLKVFENHEGMQSPPAKSKAETKNAGGDLAFAKEREKISKSETPLAKAGVSKKGSRFTAYDNGTVLDTETGLMWATKDNGQDINWKNAKTYCESCRGGYDDWRMPTQDELYGLYEAGIEPRKGMINISDWFFWAFETKGSSGAVVNFYYGYRSFFRQSFSDSLRALPVRAGK